MSLTKSLAIGTAVGTFGAVAAFVAMTGTHTDAAPAAAVSSPRVAASTAAPAGTSTAAPVFADCVPPAILEGGVCVTHIPAPVHTVTIGTGSPVVSGSGSSSASERSTAPRAIATNQASRRSSVPAPAPTRTAKATVHHHEEGDDHPAEDHPGTSSSKTRETDKPESPQTHTAHEPETGH